MEFGGRKRKTGFHYDRIKMKKMFLKKIIKCNRNIKKYEVSIVNIIKVFLNTSEYPH